MISTLANAEWYAIHTMDLPSFNRFFTDARDLVDHFVSEEWKDLDPDRFYSSSRLVNSGWVETTDNAHGGLDLSWAIHKTCIPIPWLHGTRRFRGENVSWEEAEAAYIQQIRDLWHSTRNPMSVQDIARILTVSCNDTGMLCPVYHRRGEYCVFKGQLICADVESEAWVNALRNATHVVRFSIAQYLQECCSDADLDCPLAHTDSATCPFNNANPCGRISTDDWLAVIKEAV